MTDGTLVLWILAAALGAVAFRRDRRAARAGLAEAVDRLIVTVPRIGLAVILAGFVGRLVPSEPIAHLIGPGSGIAGIAVASVAGGFVPSGPVVSFPLVLVLAEAGAGVPQLVAFLTAWSVFAFHRVLIYESTLMGWRFSAIRLAASSILPPLAGLLAYALAGLFGAG